MESSLILIIRKNINSLKKQTITNYFKLIIYNTNLIEFIIFVINFIIQDKFILPHNTISTSFKISDALLMMQYF